MSMSFAVSGRPHTPASSVPHRPPRRVVHGHKLPDERLELTPNERAWIVTLRALVGDADPPPTLRGAEALRDALSSR